jgi:hypothetical protein
MPSVAQLTRQVQAEARIVDSLDADFAIELQRVVRQLEGRIRGLIRTLDTKRGRLVMNQAALGRAMRLRVEIRAALEAAGYDAAVASFMDERLDTLTARVLEGRSLAARAARLTPVDVDTLEAWKSLRAADLLELGDDVATAVWRSTVDGVMAARRPAPLTEELAGLLEVSERQARTIYDTAASTYSRQVDQLGLDPRPGDRFVYVGPNDKATRPFCAAHVGEERTRAELDGLSNGQLPNTLATGGGWNCRHKWLFLGEAELQGSTDNRWPVQDETRREGTDREPASAAQWVRSLSTVEKDAVRNYSSHEYRFVNEAIREGHTIERGSRMESIIKGVDAALEKAPAPPKDMVVWRGVKIDRHKRDAESLRNRWPVGKTVQMDGYQSTSTKTSPANFFSDLDERARAFGRDTPAPVILEIVPKRGAFVKSLSMTPDESEFLIGRAERFKVRGIKEDVKFKVRPSDAFANPDDWITVSRTVVQLEQVD